MNEFLPGLYGIMSKVSHLKFMYERQLYSAPYSSSKMATLSVILIPGIYLAYGFN